MVPFSKRKNELKKITKHKLHNFIIVHLNLGGGGVNILFFLPKVDLD